MKVKTVRQATWSWLKSTCWQRRINPSLLGSWSIKGSACRAISAKNISINPNRKEQ
jgi:hypothetical protein